MSHNFKFLEIFFKIYILNCLLYKYIYVYVYLLYIFFFFVNYGHLPRFKQSSEHFSQINLDLVNIFEIIYYIIYYVCIIILKLLLYYMHVI